MDNSRNDEERQPEWHWLEMLLEQMFGLFLAVVKLIFSLLLLPFQSKPPDGKMKQ